MRFLQVSLQVPDIWWIRIRNMAKGVVMWSYMIRSMARVAIFEAKYTKNLEKLESDM